MRPHRVPAAARTAVCAVAALALLSGCGGAGGLKSAGDAPSAVEPQHLWPDLPPASSAPYDYGEGETARIPGIRVPGDEVRRLDPVTVAQAGLKARTNRDSGLDELPDATVRQITACRTAPDDCPVLAPYYRDLTGDGRDELVLGIRMPDRQLAVRVYMPDKGGLTRIMSTYDAVISVELAGRDVIMRAPSVIPGYEYRTAWSWDDRQRAMLPTRDEILRTPEHRKAPKPRRTPTPSADSATRTPAETP
ncbi:hypothetical protein PV376_11845 [Streptomyces sp. NRRL_ISP-5395]|uniref:hypothetical protein n=1 Tax=Streptomyces TaxID=1883 RepID=UPI001874D575|nr:MULTISPECIES: hypothetical protein [Streptomyces]MDX2670194.1 hypothetical protein [Streptomyces sp. NRRL_ISP-5395]GHF42844.1 lipoprotein [Streptomyces griseus]